MLTDTLDLGDRTSVESRGLGTFICLLPHCRASFMDDEALSLHLGSHLDMLPSATDGSVDLIRNELSSLQKAMEAISGIMRQYKNIGSSERENMKTLLRHLYVALDELRDCAERQDSNSGYTSPGIGNEEGTQVNKLCPMLYVSQNGIMVDKGSPLSYAFGNEEGTQGYERNPYLYVSIPKEGTLMDEYAALSYVWGKEEGSEVDECRPLWYASKREDETRGNKWSPLWYTSFQTLKRGLMKATERARLKIEGSMGFDLEWYNLEKYWHSAGHTHVFGGGARPVADHISLSRYCKRSYGQELGVLDLSCLILGKILCPPLQWLSLQSLQVDLSSTLDQSLRHLFPSTYQLVTMLSHHHTVALSMSLVSTSLTVLALFIPFSHISERCRSPVLICCCMALVASGPLWTYIGGSAASFFLVIMPYAMSVGISIGLLWYRCVSMRGCKIRMTQEELERRAGSSDIADY